MFHVLTENSIPNDVLVAGTWSVFADSWRDQWTEQPNSVMCGAGVGQRREAISYKKCMSYLNEGKLRNKICKACAKALRITVKEDKNVAS